MTADAAHQKDPLVLCFVTTGEAFILGWDMCCLLPVLCHWQTMYVLMDSSLTIRCENYPELKACHAPGLGLSLLC